MVRVFFAHLLRRLACAATPTTNNPHSRSLGAVNRDASICISTFSECGECGGMYTIVSTLLRPPPVPSREGRHSDGRQTDLIKDTRSCYGWRGGGSIHPFQLIKIGKDFFFPHSPATAARIHILCFANHAPAKSNCRVQGHREKKKESDE